MVWYGLLLQFTEERIFVARKNPDKGCQTTNECYIEIGEKSVSAGGRESYYSYDGEYIWSIPRTLKRVTRQIFDGKKLVIVDHADL